MKKFILFILFFFLLSSSTLVQAQSNNKDKPYVNIELFGSSQITIEQLREKLGSKLDTGDFTAREIEDTIRNMGKFAYVRCGSIIYTGEKGETTYFTINLVDEKDRSVRMPFFDPPTKDFSDPEGLLALWKEYVDKATEMIKKHELEGFVAMYVLNFNHPELKRYEMFFEEKVPKNKEALINILREDKDPSHRSSANYLLARVKDDAERVTLLLPSLHDPDSNVRNTIMRVLIRVLEKKSGVEIPIENIIEALNFPETTDRNKSAVILDYLADNPKYREIIINKAGTVLLQMLKLSQPNNHYFAYSILKKVSNKEFGEQDYKAWEEWLIKNHSEEK